MDTIISSLQDKKELHFPALNSLLSISKKSDINTLKLLNDNKNILTEIYNKQDIEVENKRTLADILSLIYILSDVTLSIQYRLLGNKIPLSEFGHQYIKKLLGTIANNKKDAKFQNENTKKELIKILLDGIKFLFEHNCEVDGVDFLFEFNLENWVGNFVDLYNFERVFNYLSEICFYDFRAYFVCVDILRRKRMWVKLVMFMERNKWLSERQEEDVVDNEDGFIGNFGLFPVDLTFEGDEYAFTYENLIEQKIFYYVTENKNEFYYSFILSVCEKHEFLQIVFVLNRTGNFYEELIFDAWKKRGFACDNTEARGGDGNDSLVSSCVNNNYLPSINEYLHSDLQIINALPIEKFIKGIPKIDSEVTLRYFAPLSISNAFVHYGFGFDSLLFTQDSEYNVDLNTIVDNDKLELLSIIGSLGLIKKNRKIKEIKEGNEDATNNTHDASVLYNTYYGMYDDLLESFAFQDSHSYKKSASLLALSLQQSFFDSNHSIFAFLSENLNSNCRYMKISSLLSIFTIYSNSHLDLVKNVLIPVLYSESVETSSFCCFCLSSVFMGSGNEEIMNLLITIFLEKKNDCESPFYLLIPLSLGILFMNKEIPDELDEFLRNNKIEGIVYGLSFMGSGRTDIIEEMVSEYVLGDEETKNSDEENKTHKDNIESVAEGTPIANADGTAMANVDATAELIGLGEVDELKMKNERTLILLGITLISLNDTHTRSITKKLLINQLMKDKNQIIPLCLAIIYTSEPDTEIIDALGRAVNANNPVNAILGLGLVGAGTNNARIMGILEQQYSYLTKNAKASGALKIAQGLVSLGKGTLSLSPLMFDKTVINKKSISALLAISILCSGEVNPLIAKHSYLLLMLSQCVSNKFVVTLNENLEFKNVTVRVGRPVETVAMAGKRSGISAVVTHESPVIVQCDEKAAIYEEEGYTFTGLVEDVVIVREKK